MRGRVAPFTVPTVVHAAKQIIEAPQMTYPQKRQLRNKGVKLKGNMTQGFQRVRNI